MIDIVERLKFHGQLERQSEVTNALCKALCNEAADEIERLRASLRECADDLAAEIEYHYAGTKDYPSEKRRYERDIQSVIKARALLEGK
jgi:hypothetical protein